MSLYPLNVALSPETWALIAKSNELATTWKAVRAGAAPTGTYTQWRRARLDAIDAICRDVGLR